MTLLAPSRLWWLAVVAALVVTYLVLQSRRRGEGARFASTPLLASVAPDRPRWRRHVAAAGVGLTLMALVVGLARPAWAQRVPREDAVVVLVLDTSDSMLATDVAPSRLEAAVVAAEEFVEGMPDRFSVGLVASARTASVLVSPTDAHAAVVDALHGLSTSPGTNTGAGLDAALDAVEAVLGPEAAGPDGGEGAATVVLLSDGATAEAPLDAATERAAEAGVPVNTIAYGTDAGTIEVDGEETPVPADPAALAEVADATGGDTFEAGSADALRGIYDELSGRISYVVEQREVVGSFLGAGFVALAATAALSMLWTARFL
jgi:Ca-activated chloride channel family protein